MGFYRTVVEADHRLIRGESLAPEEKKGIAASRLRLNLE